MSSEEVDFGESISYGGAGWEGAHSAPLSFSTKYPFPIFPMRTSHPARDYLSIKPGSSPFRPFSIEDSLVFAVMDATRPLRRERGRVMGAEIIEDESLRNKTNVFRDRAQAGDRLAAAVDKYRGRDGWILAIPSGGIPVGLGISHHLELPLDLVISRKIPIPGNPEAGFGALSFEGGLFLNEALVGELGLTREEIQGLIAPVREEIRHRNTLFRGGRRFPDLGGKVVILVDDGLASGYTMMASISFVKKRKPSRVVVAIPTAPESTVERIAPQADEIVCLNIRRGFFFAVADAYREWYDLSDDEVMKLLG